MYFVRPLRDLGGLDRFSTYTDGSETWYRLWLKGTEHGRGKESPVGIESLDCVGQEVRVPFFLGGDADTAAMDKRHEDFHDGTRKTV